MMNHREQRAFLRAETNQFVNSAFWNFLGLGVGTTLLYQGIHTYRMGEKAKDTALKIRGFIMGFVGGTIFSGSIAHFGMSATSLAKTSYTLGAVSSIGVIGFTSLFGIATVAVCVDILQKKFREVE